MGAHSSEPFQEGKRPYQGPIGSPLDPKYVVELRTKVHSDSLYEPITIPVFQEGGAHRISLRSKYVIELRT